MPIRKIHFCLEWKVGVNQTCVRAAYLEQIVTTYLSFFIEPLKVVASVGGRSIALSPAVLPLSRSWLFTGKWFCLPVGVPYASLSASIYVEVKTLNQLIDGGFTIDLTYFSLCRISRDLATSSARRLGQYEKSWETGISAVGILFANPCARYSKSHPNPNSEDTMAKPIIFSPLYVFNF